MANTDCILCACGSPSMLWKMTNIVTQSAHRWAGVITAMIGFFTSFGIGKKAFPAKLKEKQEQRLVVAERLLERELARERKAVA